MALGWQTLLHPTSPHWWGRGLGLASSTVLLAAICDLTYPAASNCFLLLLALIPLELVAPRLLGFAGAWPGVPVLLGRLVAGWWHPSPEQQGRMVQSSAGPLRPTCFGGLSSGYWPDGQP